MNTHCSTCNYTARDNFNYNKHILTEKHKKKVDEVANTIITKPLKNLAETPKEHVGFLHKCQFCDNTYSTSGSLARHKKACSEKIELTKELEKDRNELNIQKEVELLKKELQCKEELIKSLKSEVSNLRMLVTNAGSMVKSSLSTISYVIKNYNEAPALEGVKNMEILHSDKTKEEFSEKLISEYRHKTLTNFIGNIIVKTYKKEDPSKQSLWNSDTARLTYVIRVLLDKNNIDWTVDKKGLRTHKCIIEPVLDYILECLDSFIDNFDTDYRLDSTAEAESKMMKLKHANEIIQLIDDKVLSEDILKYIAPYFYLAKTEAALEE